MSLDIRWKPPSSKETLDRLRSDLETLINSSYYEKPTDIYGDISIADLSFGTHAPDVAICDIPLLNEEELQLDVSIRYEGDASVELETRAQINPLFVPGEPESERPFVVPVRIKMDALAVDWLCRIHISKHTGIAMVHLKEPTLELQVHSTFDDVGAIRKFLQSVIERRLQDFVSKELPALLKTLGTAAFFADNSSDAHIPSDSSLLPSSRGNWFLDNDALLAASYASPDGLFLVEQRIFGRHSEDRNEFCLSFPIPLSNKTFHFTPSSMIKCTPLLSLCSILSTERSPFRT